MKSVFLRRLFVTFPPRLGEGIVVFLRRVTGLNFDPFANKSPIRKYIRAVDIYVLMPHVFDSWVTDYFPS